jgi:hypothetical protein
MTLLFETNRRHSRLLFLSSLIIALVLSPVVLRLVEHSMSGLCERTAPGRSQRLAMGYAFHVVLRGSRRYLCTEGKICSSPLLSHDLSALTSQSA